MNSSEGAELVDDHTLLLLRAGVIDQVIQGGDGGGGGGGGGGGSPAGPGGGGGHGGGGKAPVFANASIPLVGDGVLKGGDGSPPASPPMPQPDTPVNPPLK